MGAAGTLLDALENQWPPAGVSGCRLCARDWGPFREGRSICEPCWAWAAEFAAGRGRGPALSPLEQLKKALRRFARGRQISDRGAQWILDNFRGPW